MFNGFRLMPIFTQNSRKMSSSHAYRSKFVGIQTNQKGTNNSRFNLLPFDYRYSSNHINNVVKNNQQLNNKNKFNTDRIDHLMYITIGRENPLDAAPGVPSSTASRNPTVLSRKSLN